MANKIVVNCPYCGKPHSVPVNRFESEAQIVHQASQDGRQSGFWASDGATYTLAGFMGFCGAYVVCWSYGWPASYAVSFGVMAGLGLHLLKVVLYAPPKPKASRAGEAEHIKVTVNTPLPNSNTIQLDETFGVKAAALRYVAKRVIADGQSFSRRKCYKRGVCSQTDFEKIQEVMIGRYWAVYDPSHPQSGVELNRHGKAVLRAVLKS